MSDVHFSELFLCGGVIKTAPFGCRNVLARCYHVMCFKIVAAAVLQSTQNALITICTRLSLIFLTIIVLKIILLSLNPKHEIHNL